jgi:hypothetical protein
MRELTTNQLTEKYEVLAFSAPYVLVKDKATGERGSFEFRGFGPRKYFNFKKG